MRSFSNKNNNSNNNSSENRSVSRFYSHVPLKSFRKKEIVSDVNETNLQKLFLGIYFSKLLWTVAISLRWCPPPAPQGNTYTHHWKENRRGKLEALACLLFQNSFCYFSVSLNWPFSLSWDKLGLKVGLSRDETAFKKKKKNRKEEENNIKYHAIFISELSCAY